MDDMKKLSNSRKLKQESFALLTLVSALAALADATPAHAGLFEIRPIHFGDGIVATGTIATDGATSTIIDWNLTVTTTEQLARFTPLNAPLKGVAGLKVTGNVLTLATSPDPGNEPGGSLQFRAANPSSRVSVAVADFTDPLLPGGLAQFRFGSAFDTVDLAAAAGVDYPIGTAGIGGAHHFDLSPVHFGNGVTMTGTIRTDGAAGQLDAANVIDWDIVVNQVTEDAFTKQNSFLAGSGIATTPDGLGLSVENPGGSMMFVKGLAGGHLYALQLADFTDSSVPVGQAGYFQGRLAIHTINLGAPRGAWIVTGSDAIATPDNSGSLALMFSAISSLAGIGMLARRDHKSTGSTNTGDSAELR